MGGLPLEYLDPGSVPVPQPAEQPQPLLPQPPPLSPEQIQAARDEKLRLGGESVSLAQGYEQSVKDRAAELERILGQRPPAPQAPPELPPPPSQKIRPFADNTPGEPWEATLNKSMMTLGLLAQGVTGLAAKYPQGALAAMTGAMQGWAEGDKLRGDREFKEWGAKTQAMKEKFEMDRQHLRDLWNSHHGDIESLKSKLAIDAAKMGASQGVIEALQKNPDTVLGWADDNLKYGKSVFQMWNELGLKKWAKEQQDQHLAEQNRHNLEQENIGRMMAQAAIDRANRDNNPQNRPIGASVNLYRHKDTWETPDPNMTALEAANAGFVKATPKQLEGLAGIEKTRGLVSEIAGYAKQLITAEDPGSATAQAAARHLGAFLGTDPSARTYKQTRQSMVGVLARSIGAERGVLTDKDVMRADSMLPNFGDTATIRNQKLGKMQAALDLAEESEKAAITGKPVDRATFEKRMDAIVGLGMPKEKAKAVPAAPGEAAAPSGSVMMRSPSGVLGSVPQSRVEEARAKGYRLAE